MTGTIIRLIPSRGYGFIRDEQGMTRFAHAKSFTPPIDFDRAREGAAVVFDPSDGGPSGNRLRAENIKVQA